MTEGIGGGRIRWMWHVPGPEGTGRKGVCERLGKAQEEAEKHLLRSDQRAYVASVPAYPGPGGKELYGPPTSTRYYTARRSGKRVAWTLKTLSAQPRPVRQRASAPVALGNSGLAPGTPPDITKDHRGGMHMVASRCGTLFFQGTAGQPPEAS